MSTLDIICVTWLRGAVPCCVYRVVSWKRVSETGEIIRQNKLWLTANTTSTSVHIHAVKTKPKKQNMQDYLSLYGKWLSSTVVMAEVQQYQTLCQGCLGWTWALRTLCHCHAGMNKVETGPSISVLPSDYEQIMQPHSMLYITGYGHALLPYTPFVPKLNNWIAPTPFYPSRHLIKYAMYPRHLNSSSRICLYLFISDHDSDVNQCLNEIDGVFTHIKQQLLGWMLFIERTQSYLKWLIVLITLCSYSQFSVRWTNKRSVWESKVWLAKSLFKSLFKIHFYKLAFTALTALSFTSQGLYEKY